MKKRLRELLEQNRMEEIADLLREADYWADRSDHEVVGAVSVQIRGMNRASTSKGAVECAPGGEGDIRGVEPYHRNDQEQQDVQNRCLEANRG